MAKIWLVYEGREPTRGGPLWTFPVWEAVSLFELRPDDFVSDLAETPRFGPVDRDLWYLGYKHIVVEIDRSELRRTNWKPGFYRSRITPPKDLLGWLIEQTLVLELGAENVMRVVYETATDSQGQDALKITVVLAPDATKELAREATLNALVRLRLSMIQEDRIPIIEYATEAELVEDGSP